SHAITKRGNFARTLDHGWRWLFSQFNTILSGYFFDQQQQQQQQFGPFMNELHSQLNVGEGSQSRPGSASSDITSSPTSPVAVASTSTASSPESGPVKRTYDKWVRR
ncbi:hypothetical protein ACROYT_G035459, partial [Oculina patagonica]